MTVSPNDDDPQADPEIAAAIAAEIDRLREDGKVVHIEPRCKICRDAPVRRLVNKLLTMGITRAEVVQTLEPLNLQRADPITYHNVYTHQQQHFDVGQSMHRVYNEIVRKRAVDAGMEDFDTALGVAVNVKSFYQIMMVKGLATLMDEDTVVTPAEGATAAARLYDLESKESGTQRIAEIMAQQNHIIRVAQETIPPELVPVFLARLENRPVPHDTLDVEVVEDDEVFDPGEDEDEDD